MGIHSKEVARGQSEDEEAMELGACKWHNNKPPFDSGPVIRLSAELVNGTLYVIPTQVHGDGGWLPKVPRPPGVHMAFSQ